MKRFNNILLVADGENWQDAVFHRAVTLAENNQANLTIIHALNLPLDTNLLSDTTYDKITNAIIADIRSQLDEITATAPAGVNISGKVIRGAIFPDIIQEVLRNGYDLVVKRSATRSIIQDRIFGSADMHLLRKCPCPVWIMSSNDKVKYQRILAAVDVDQETRDKRISSLNQQIIELASSLALSEFSELHIVHAWKAWGESKLNSPRFNFDKKDVADWVEQRRVEDESKMKDLMKTLPEFLSPDAMEYLKPQLHIVKGQACDVIPSVAKEIKSDLVVMGTVARTGIPGFFIGNTAESTLGSIGCSVLAVKPPGFTTPVTLES